MKIAHVVTKIDIPLSIIVFMQNEYHVTCTTCNIKASVIEEPRYNGLRGICANCGGNWPES